MEQKEPVLVLYDREEEYARLFSEYLKRQKELPWQIHTYTRAEELLAGEKSGEVTMLVVAESSCEEALNTLQPTCQAILNESGTLRFHQFPNINKCWSMKIIKENQQSKMPRNLFSVHWNKILI